MLEILLKNTPPFSVNKAWYKKTFTRTRECRAWGQAIADQIENDATLQAQICSFKEQFNPLEQFLTVHIYFFQPTTKLLSKKGNLKRLGQDLSNVEKMLIDIIFDPRHSDRNLGLDDCLIGELHSFKRIAPQQKIIIRIKSSNLKALKYHGTVPRKHSL